jgi:hypothetical protein
MVDNKTEILERLAKLWDKYPEQRLGQLLENYVFFNGKRGDITSVKLFFQRDENTLEILKSQTGGNE